MFRKIESVDYNETRQDLRSFRIISRVFLVVGALVSVYAVRLDWILLQSQSWPVAQGEVVSAERITNSKGVRYTYRYTKDGRQLESSNVIPGMDFQDFIPFSKGSEISVHHAPGEREYSFIKMPDPVLIILPNVIGFCFFTIGGFATFSLIRRK